MSFLKTHLPPTLHNAAGTLIAVGVLAVGAGLIAFIRPLRDAAVPLWVVVILLVSCIAVAFVRSKTQNQKRLHSIAQLQERQAAEIAALTKSRAEQHVKDQKTIERLTQANSRKDEEIATLKKRVSDLEHELAPYRERFSKDKMFTGFQDEQKKST